MDVHNKVTFQILKKKVVRLEVDVISDCVWPMDWFGLSLNKKVGMGTRRKCSFQKLFLLEKNVDLQQKQQ